MNKKLLFVIMLILLYTLNLNATVFASVNGEEIQEEDINLIMKTMQGVNFESLSAENKKKIVNQAIERKLLTSEAKKSNLENNKEYLKALERIKSDLALEMWMKQMYDSVEEIDGALKMEKFREHVSKKAKELAKNSKIIIYE